MASIRVDGRTYELRMDVRAMGEIEKKYGDVQEALKKFRAERKVSMVAELFAILANSGEKHAGRPMNVTADALDSCGLKGLSDVSAAMSLCMEESMHAETVNGNEADDTVVDVYERELEEREKNA